MEVEGIVLQVTSYKEKDAIVTILARQGVISFLARGVLGINSKNAPSINLYTRSSFELVEKGTSDNYTLRTGLILDDLHHLYENLNAMLSLSFLGELTLKCADDENAVFLYPLLMTSLQKMKENYDMLTIELTYLSTIIKMLGISLHTDDCLVCHSKKNIVTISYDDGGFLCDKCYNPFTQKNYSANYLKIIRYLFKNDSTINFPVELPNQEAKEVLNDLVMYLYSQLGIKLKSFDIKNQLSR